MDIEQKISFLKEVSDYFDNMTREDGSIFCEKDRIEHTGKNTYSVIIDSELYKLTGDEKYFQRAQRRVKRALSNFIRDPEYDVPIFYPGRLNPRNAVNTAIGGGGIVDSLCFYIETFKDKLSNEEIEKIKEAVFKHADEYLKIAAIKKPVTNQRLWAATGLASAYSIFRNEEWKKILIKTIEISLSEQNLDGSFFYYKNYKEASPEHHPGIADITPYYHGRHLAFIIHILEKIDEPISNYIDELKKGTDFLIGMYQKNGVKSILLEGKRWYWESDYEVVSHPFDIYLLVKMWQKTGDEVYKNYAIKSFEVLTKHQDKDGGIISHKGYGHNWQCRVLWSSHIAWVAKIIKNISKDEIDDTFLKKIFRNAGLLKFENQNYSAVVRFKKKPMNIDFGSSIGGGSLLYCGYKENNWKNHINTFPWKSASTNNFIAQPKDRPGLTESIKDFVRYNKTEFLGQRWRFYVEFTAGNIFFAFKKLYKEIVWKFFEELKNEYTSQWLLEATPEIKNNTIIFKSGLAKRNGEVLVGAGLNREYEFGEQGFALKEQFGSFAPLKTLKYITNPNFKYQIESNTDYKVFSDCIIFSCYEKSQINLIISICVA